MSTLKLDVHAVLTSGNETPFYCTEIVKICSFAVLSESNNSLNEYLLELNFVIRSKHADIPYPTAMSNE